LIGFALFLLIPIAKNAGLALPTKSDTRWLYIVVIVFLAIPASIWVAARFVEVFTTDTDTNNTNESKKAVDRIVSSCYVFAVVALFASFLPALVMFGLYLVGDPDNPKSLARLFYIAMTDSPVGVVRGCVHAPNDPTWELACKFPNPRKNDSGDKYGAQWLVNIGGSAQYLPAIPTPTPTAIPTSAVTPSATAVTPSATDTAAGAALAIAVSKEGPTESALGNNDSHSGSAPDKNSKDNPKPSPTGTPDDIEPDLSESVFYKIIIHGGLEVPWYFTMLAVMGAAVSMARKVPEYQRRVHSPDKLDGKVNPEYLSPTKAREYLVFQVLQVLSAPLIAITAYNAITPSSRATSVALGFASGFASESILVGIRALADKVRPEEKAVSKDT
jgi:hypothetical protein